MCGIFGIYYFDSARAVSERLLHAMGERLVHRGPDDSGMRIDGSVGFGCRRLKIIDLAGSQQPLTNEDGRIWLTCNGEIYNFRTLRQNLRERHQFATAGDVESIAHLYEDFGAGCVHHLRGMFAFALWDASTRTITFAVDRFGKKPLYYWLDHEKIVFASELKALLPVPDIPREIDYEAVDEYFSCGYISVPRTIYRGIRRLPAGHLLLIQGDGTTKLETYWQPRFAEPDSWDTRPAPVLAADLRQLLTEAVRLRMLSDVPIGAFLSGGIDSSAVVALMSSISGAPVKTFSVGFAEPEYDERPYAQAAAEHCGADHYSVTIGPTQALELLPRLVKQYDEPFADSSMIPTYVVSELARQQVTVALSGDGGDEVFAGYHQHLYGYRQQYLESIMSPAAGASIARVAGMIPRVHKAKPYLAAMGRPAHHWLTSGFFAPEHRAALFEDASVVGAGERVKLEPFAGVKALDRLSQLQYHDIIRYLPGDILVKVDRASMAASLEVRSPLLDNVIFEFMARVPPSQRVGLQSGKPLLKLALGSALPRAVSRRPKQGFSIPQAEWLRGPFLPLVRDLLLAPSATFNRSCASDLIDEHLSGRADHKDRLWALLCFSLWERG